MTLAAYVAVDPDNYGYVCARCPDGTRAARRCTKPLKKPEDYAALRAILTPWRFSDESCAVLKVHPEAWSILDLAASFDKGHTWAGKGLGDEPYRLAMYMRHVRSEVSHFTERRYEREPKKSAPPPIDTAGSLAALRSRYR